jgi:lipopolysaccharide transport system permease protein
MSHVKVANTLSDHEMKTHPHRNSGPLPVTVYTSEKGLAHPLKLLGGLIRDICSPRTMELAYRMMVRNISATYRQSLFGVFWIFLPALANALAWIFLNKANVISVPQTNLPYPVFVLTGTILWQIFTQGLVDPIASVNRERATLTRINIPNEAVLIASFGNLVFCSAIQALVLIPVFVWFRIDWAWTMLLGPVGLVTTGLLGFAIGLLLAPLGLLYQDVARAIPIVARLWFFITPVAYPSPKNLWASTVFRVNPATSVIDGARNWLTGQAVSQPVDLAVVLCLAILILIMGVIAYRLTMPVIIERISA